MESSFSQLIDGFANGATTPARWVAGLSKPDLLAHPVPGTWSIQELVVHVLDSDLAASHRMRRMVAEDLPLIIAYDETAFSKTLRYDQMDLGEVVELFRLHRVFVARWLRTLPREAFAREGVHNQRGKVNVAGMIQIYIDHLTHHEKFLIEKRRVMGKPMA